jgi:hypothetical protein
MASPFILVRPNCTGLRLHRIAAARLMPQARLPLSHSKDFEDQRMMTKEALKNELRSYVPGLHIGRRVSEGEMIETFGGFPTRKEVQRWLKINKLNFSIEFSPTLPGWYFRRR